MDACNYPLVTFLKTRHVMAKDQLICIIKQAMIYMYIHAGKTT